MSGQSRNAWIKLDDPHTVSVISKDTGDFSDLLIDRRTKGDLQWCLRSREIPQYKYNKERLPPDVITATLASDRVKYAVQKHHEETGEKLDVIWDEVHAIIKEMSHTQSMAAIRCFAFVLVKVMKSLYRRIYVNQQGIETVRNMVKEYPVLFLPSHRSYLDFLLLSYVTYHHDLPLPVIAAAMDFMSMKFVGWLFRNCGAFFIRRSFGTDRLYWAVFTEYVQSHICNGDSPVEFFVEGTRSRTQKSLIPKTGMFEVVLEPYFKAQVPDIIIIPVSISYDRVIEESLYAYELLGIPKPKESTSGLLRARSVLSEDFGNVHVYMGEPVSVHELAVGKLDRLAHSLAPKYVYRLTKLEKEFINAIAHHVLRRIEKHQVLNPFCLVATVLMLNPTGISLQSLLREVEWLKATATSVGAYVDWPGGEPAMNVLMESLQIHKTVVNISNEQLVSIVTEEMPPGHVGPKINPNLLQAAAVIRCSLYRNQLLHVFVRLAMVCYSLGAHTTHSTQTPLTLDVLADRYSFLEGLMKRDFIFEPGHTEKNLTLSLEVLRRMGGVVVNDRVVSSDTIHSRLSNMLVAVFEPFIVAYWVVIEHFIEMPATRPGHTLRSLASSCQRVGARLIADGVVRHADILSLDTLSNAINSLADMGALLRITGLDSPRLVPVHVRLSHFNERLHELVELPRIPPGLAAPYDIHQPSAKL